MPVSLPRGTSTQQAAEAAQHPSSWGALSACLHGVTMLSPCMRKVTCPLCPQGENMMGNIPAASRVSGTGWKHHTSNRYKYPPGFTPSFCPAHLCSMFLQPCKWPTALLGPSLVPAGAELVFTNHHKTPSALPQLKLQHGDAWNTKQMCCTTLSDVPVTYKTYVIQKGRQWELFRAGSTTVVLFISITKNITFKCLK